MYSDKGINALAGTNGGAENDGHENAGHVSGV